MKRLIYSATLSICSLLFSTRLCADTITINFDNLQDSQVVGAAYASSGVIFSGAVVATAGVSLNELEFPPHSGSNVVVDATGPIMLSFATPVSTFSGYFTYAEPLTLDGFGASNQLLANASSALLANYASTGNQPNELIQLASAAGISSITITGEPAGSSFALDDVTFTTAPVPEPGTLSLITMGGCLLLFRLQRLRSRA